MTDTISHERYAQSVAHMLQHKPWTNLSNTLQERLVDLARTHGQQVQVTMSPNNSELILSVLDRNSPPSRGRVAVSINLKLTRSPTSGRLIFKRTGSLIHDNRQAIATGGDTAPTVIGLISFTHALEFLDDVIRAQGEQVQIIPGAKAANLVEPEQAQGWATSVAPHGSPPTFNWAIDDPRRLSGAAEDAHEARKASVVAQELADALRAQEATQAPQESKLTVEDWRLLRELVRAHRIVVACQSGGHESAASATDARLYQLFATLSDIVVELAHPKS